MSETGELRRRIDALEAEVDTLREQFTVTRAVVALSDRDAEKARRELRDGFATVLAAVQAISDRLPDPRGG